MGCATVFVFGPLDAQQTGDRSDGWKPMAMSMRCQHTWVSHLPIKSVGRNIVTGGNSVTSSSTASSGINQGSTARASVS
jgi:hypothetical protein